MINIDFIMPNAHLPRGPFIEDPRETRYKSKGDKPLSTFTQLINPLLKLFTPSN